VLVVIPIDGEAAAIIADMAAERGAYNRLRSHGAIKKYQLLGAG
jgi:hypothetical protein